MLLTLCKEAKEVVSKNLLKIAIAGALTFFMEPIQLAILLIIIGYWILNLESNFNLKTIIIIGLYSLTILLYGEVNFSINKIEDYIGITKIVLPIALIIDWFIEREIAPNVLIFIYFQVFYFIFNNLEFSHQQQDLCDYSLIILAYFLFFTVQEKKLKECLSIKGILTIVCTFIIFYLINFYRKDLNNFLWKTATITSSNLVLIFLICGGYYLKIFYYVLVFNLIKNLKRDNSDIKEDKNNFNIETKDNIKQNILKIISLVFLMKFFSFPLNIEIVLLFIGCWLFRVQFNLKMLTNVGIYFLIINFKDFASITALDFMGILPILIGTLIASSIELSKNSNKILIIILYIFFILAILLSNCVPMSYQDEVLLCSLAIVSYFSFFTMQEKNLKDCLSIKGVVSIVITLIIFYCINFVNILSFFKFNNDILEYTIMPSILEAIKIFYYIFVFNLIKNLRQ